VTLRLENTIFLIVLALAGVGSCLDAWQKHETASRQLTKAKAIELVRADLKYPATSKFSDVRQSSVSKSVFCGLVDAQNDLGAFTGSKHFVVDLRDRSTFVEGDADNQTMTMSLQSC
jgi:hypothetical protein